MSNEGMEVLARELVREIRRMRRGRWMFRLLLVLVLAGVAVAPLLDGYRGQAEPHTAVVDLQGVIGIGEDASADRVNEALRAAFAGEGVKGIIVRVNSPGGSPVQSRRINLEIDRLQAQHPELPVYAVVEEICASGGYYAAVAADRIFADPASIVGSIGVRLDSFGFVEAMERLGIERRLITAGANKGILDPFLPLRDDDAEFAEGLLATVHRQFIDTVRRGRGDRLSGDEDILFSGLFWGGEDALALGLVDGLGSVDSVARDEIGAEKLVNYSPEYGVFEELARDFGAAIAAVVSRITALGGPRLL